MLSISMIGKEMCKRVSPDISSFQMCCEMCSQPCKLYLSVQDSQWSVCVSDSKYTKWIHEIKEKYSKTQIKAALKVNSEQLIFN